MSYCRNNFSVNPADFCGENLPDEENFLKYGTQITHSRLNIQCRNEDSTKKHVTVM